MAHLRIRLLGAFQASMDGKLIHNFESNKVRALLAYLAVESSQPHAREALVEMFWPGMPPKRGSSNLSQALYNLNQVINTSETNERFLLRSYESVQFNPECDYWLDVDVFNRQFDLARMDGDRAAYQEVVHLYQGDFLSGFLLDGSPAFDEWLLIERHRLQRRAMAALRQLAKYCALDGDLDDALIFAWREVDLEPLSEPACRQLMRLLDESGQRSQALVQFERLQVLLSEELKILPEQKTITLHNQIRRKGYGSNLSTDSKDNLPSFLTPLIGRQVEIKELRALLSNSENRLVTILGPGGSGKSRLALEVARTIRNTFPEGVFFVSLNPVQSANSIFPAIVEALSLSLVEIEDSHVQLINYLRDKQLLLILDGFEHLLDGAAQVVEILKHAPSVKILVTSRTRLGLKGEHIYPLAGMRYPTEQATLKDVQSSDAVQLLIEALQRSRHDFQPNESDLKHLRQICQDVLGMPLGILLAASWGGTLEVDEIAEMVSKSLDFLAVGWDDLPERQRSLRATFEYTWNLLSQRQRDIFQRLAVFRGAFSRKAAREVSGATPFELRELLERSLLWHKSPGWYEMHELLRQFGREVLGQSSKVELKVCRLHSQYYLGRLSDLCNAMKGKQQPSAIANIDLEHENYRAAWDWAAAQGALDLLYLAAEVFCLYYELSVRYSDGESACRTVLETLSSERENAPLCMILLTWHSRFCRLLGQPAESRGLLDQAKDQFKAITISDDGLIGRVDAFLALEEGCNYFKSDRAASVECFQHSLRIYRELDDSWGISAALSRLGYIAHHAGNYQQAVAVYTECLDLNRILGAPRSIAMTLINLGQNRIRLGNFEKGEQNILEGVSILHQIGDQGGFARGSFELARYYFWVGEFEKSCQYNEKSIPIFYKLGILDQYIFASIGLGLGLTHLGKYTEAIGRMFENLPLAKDLDSLREIGMAYVILGMAYLGRGEFEQAEKSAQKSAKKYRNLNQQEELCLALAVLVYTQIGTGQLQNAIDYLQEILQIALEIHGLYPILYILHAATHLLSERGKVDMALEVSVLTKKYPFIQKSRWFEDISGRKITALTESFPEDVVRASQDCGCKMDIWEIAGELLDELKDPIEQLNPT